MKKILTFFLVVAMLFSLTGCQNLGAFTTIKDGIQELIGGSKENDGDNKTDSTDIDLQELETYKITVGIPENVLVEDYDKTEFTQYMKSEYCLEIEYIHFVSNAEDYMQALTTMCVAGEQLPDVLLGFRGLDQEAIEACGKDGYFQPIESTMLSNMENYNQYYESLPREVRNYIKDTTSYSMPIVEGDTIVWGRIITKDCQNLDAAYRLLDAMYSEKVMELNTELYNF